MGSSRSQLKRWARIFVGVVASNAPLIQGIRPRDRTPSSPMDVREPGRTELVQASDLGYDREARITVEEFLPIRTEINAIMGELSGDNL